MSDGPGCFRATVFSTCPQSADFDPAQYRARVIETAKWCDDIGCTGVLIYTDNRLVDPWLVAQVILQNTTGLIPLVAVQPIYMHPYTVANMVASLAYLYRRRVYLNMVAGGFTNDLAALKDRTPHDRRYDRLVEYTKIVIELVNRSRYSRPFSFDGEFYKVENLKLTPPVPAELAPGVFLSGSSDAGLAAARSLGATAVQYPEPASEYADGLPAGGVSYGMRVGIIARANADDAWRAARERFPEDRRGQLVHQLAMKTSDSVWHKQLSELAATTRENNPYWLLPFENYKTFCPYLVGSFDRVAQELARYMRVGYGSFILDIPLDRRELECTVETFARAERLVSP